MTDLSPAAQAVLDAAYQRMDENPHNEVEATLAAALRAAADEVCLRWAELEHPADVLNAIADELEKQ
jgi:hypothetical protein